MQVWTKFFKVITVIKVIVKIKMSVVYSHALNYTQGDLVRNQEMDHSNIGDPQKHCHRHQNSGLMRHRSAPSPMLTNLLVDTIINHHDDVDHHHHYIPNTSSEMEAMLAKLISPNNNNMLSSSEPLYGGREVKKEEEGDKGYNFGSNNEAQMIYQHHHEQIQGLPNGSMNGFDGSFNAVNSTALESNTQAKMGSNLIRQESSPAGFFSNYSVDNAFRACDDMSNGQATTSNSGGIHGTLNFKTRPSYCNMGMPRIVESGNEEIEPNCVEKRNMRNDNGSNKSYVQSFTSEFWDGSAFNGSKTASGNCEITFSTSKNALEAQDADFGYQKLGLTHHLSLPSSSTKMGGMDKLFQIQGSVPCKIRAKRGFATHPRSIAERERRTRISERIKKLQDLFPKSDKQTSTADMLDLAVEYIKDLQKQVKILKDSRAKCTCSSNQKQ